MGHTLIALLVANVVLAAGTEGTVLYTAGLPYPYISSYAFTYSYTHPPLILPQAFSLECEGEPLTLSETPALPPQGADLPLEGIPVEGPQGILPNQSTSEPSSALGDAALPTEPESLQSAADASPSPAPVSPAPTALGETASAPPTAPPATPPTANELKNPLSLNLSPVTYTIPTPLAWPTASQYHQQDELGQYNYGYANEHSAKQEFKLLDGVTRGAYNYVDAEGKLQTVSYVSDGEGFRVAATNLPQPAVPVDIPDSPEVAAAKAAHSQALSEAVANVNIANAADAANAADEAAAAIEAAAASATGNNAANGCNEPSAGNSTPTEI